MAGWNRVNDVDTHFLCLDFSWAKNICNWRRGVQLKCNVDDSVVIFFWCWWCHTASSFIDQLSPTISIWASFPKFPVPSPTFRSFDGSSFPHSYLALFQFSPAFECWNWIFKKCSTVSLIGQLEQTNCWFQFQLQFLKSSPGSLSSSSLRSSHRISESRIEF